MHFLKDVCLFVGAGTVSLAAIYLILNGVGAVLAIMELLRGGK